MSRPPKPPADPFEWSAWLRDKNLRACGYAARGLWFDMLCVMAEAEPKGQMRIAGRACDVQAIARVTGGNVDEVAPLLAELERNAVFSRLDDGAIYCRRMVRDAERSGTASQAGRRGGARPELPLLLPGFGAKTLEGLEGKTTPKPTLSLDSKKDSEFKFKQGSKTDSNLIPRARPSAPHHLPDGWTLTNTTHGYAFDRGFSDNEISDLVEAFRDNHRQKGTKGLDWDAGWRMWVRNEIKFNGDPRRGNYRKSGGRPDNSHGKITPADLAMGRYRRTQ